MIVSLAAVELPGWLTWLTSVATVVIAVSLTVTAVSLVVIANAARKQMVRVSKLVETAFEALKPAIRHGEEVASNLNYISASVRDDVEQFKGTLRKTQTRLERAAHGTERRIADFNALLGVVQEEAEDLFVNTASTLRGVQAGAERLRAPLPDAWEEELGTELEGEEEIVERTYPPRRRPADY